MKITEDRADSVRRGEMKGKFEKLSDYYKWRLAGEQRMLRAVFVLLAIFSAASFILYSPVAGFIALAAECVLVVAYFVFGAVMRGRIRRQLQVESESKNRLSEQKEKEE